VKTQLFEVTHCTAFRYSSSVAVSHNLLRLTPRRMLRQRPFSHAIELNPAPEASSRHFDCFGNEVMFATIAEAHKELRVISRSTVALGPATIPDKDETPSWEQAVQISRTDRTASCREALEFVFPSSMAPVDDKYAGYARPSFEPGRPILEAVLDLTERIYREFTFDPAATTIATPLDQVLREKRGVCQDFAHFQIACLRSLDIPARYVSGYIETLPPPGQSKLAGADASHAWTSFFCPGMGWIDVDPTNNLLPSMQHITLAWGRDYGDVSPIRGVVIGGDKHALSVTVDVVAQGVIDTGGLLEEDQSGR